MRDTRAELCELEPQSWKQMEGPTDEDIGVHFIADEIIDFNDQRFSTDRAGES